MDTGVIVALIGLTSGVVTALISLAMNRLNRKDAKEDKASEDLIEAIHRIDRAVSELDSKIIPLQKMSRLSVGDKLNHYAHKYLARGTESDIQSVKDWLALEEAYEQNGGNGHIKKLRPDMEELLIMLETEKEKKEQ